jgi:hypothetical protein
MRVKLVAVVLAIQSDPGHVTPIEGIMQAQNTNPQRHSTCHVLPLGHKICAGCERGRAR